jgi:hypothetical protein
MTQNSHGCVSGVSSNADVGAPRYGRLQCGFTLSQTARKGAIRQLAKLCRTLANVISALSWLLMLAAVPFIIAKLIAVVLDTFGEALWNKAK